MINSYFPLYKPLIMSVIILVSNEKEWIIVIDYHMSINDSKRRANKGVGQNITQEALHKHAHPHNIQRKTNHAPPPTYQDLWECNRSPNSAHSLPIMQHLQGHRSSSFVSLPPFLSIMHNYDKDITSYHNTV